MSDFISSLTDSFNQIANSASDNAELLITMMSVLLAVFIINLMLGKRLQYLGIIPREPFGLLGIICSPFLHANFNHLFFNSIPLIILSTFILIEGQEAYLTVAFYITLISGFLTWCFARKAIHVGASSVITGFWGYLVLNSYLHPSFLAVILGIICIYYFAGIFFGIFPQEKGISWEGHLFGLIAGILVNLLLQYFPVLYLS